MRVSGVPYEVDGPKEYTMEFEFTFRGQQWPENFKANELTKKLVVDDCTTWSEIHEEFLDFLSAAYGYNVKDLVNKDDTNTFSNS